MNSLFAKLKLQASEFWTNFDKTQKKRLYITTAIVVVAVTIAIIILTRPSYTTLVSNTDAKQVAEMKKILDDNKIWNAVGEDGGSITVNQKDKGRARIAVSDKGYPKQGLTFEDAISMIGISTTESDKKHIWKQQEKSEIESMIMSYDNVEYAEVILAMPEKTLFSLGENDQPGPRAIVRITPSEKLTQKQIQGIVMLVSRSVVNLDPENITIVDNLSNILNSDIENDSVDMANTQEKLRRDMETHLQNKVYDYFNVGEYDSFDTIRVIANPVLDFDKSKSQIKLIDTPSGMEEGAVLNSDILKEKVENGTSGGGAPGLDTNPGNTNSPSYQIGDSENSNYNKSHEIKNYAYNETITEQEKATGALIPSESTMAISLWYGQRVTDDSKMSDDFLDQIRFAASTATGIPIKNISVMKLKLKAPEDSNTPLPITNKDNIFIYGIAILFSLIILGVIIMIFINSKKKKNISVEMLQAAATENSNDIIPDIQENYLLDIEMLEQSEVKRQIENFIKQKPEAVAQLLKNWLSDEWDV